jgi:hypothetical protein
MKSHRFIRNSEIRQNRYLYISAICMMIYALIELTDCITIVFISFGRVPNIYLSMDLISFEAIVSLLETQPYTFIPFFFAFTLIRVISTIGLFKNREWGFWIGVSGLLVTMILTILFLPMGSVEILFCAVLLCIMIIGKFDKKKIVEH